MYNRKKMEEEVPCVNTAIWSCVDEGCNGWMRDNFAFEHAPICRICQSPMKKSEKMLPELANPSGDMKHLKKGIQIL